LAPFDNLIEGELTGVRSPSLPSEESDSILLKRIESRLLRFESVLVCSSSSSVSL
jgi:hypothetical protein